MSRLNKREEIQEQIVNSLTNSKSKCMAIHVTQRTGKTRAILNYLNQYKNSKILIAYPDNKIKDSWLIEIEKIKYKNPNVIFCNFSSLKKYTEETFDYVVIDEGHSLSQFELERTQEILDSTKKKMIISSGTLNDKTQELLKLYLNMDIVFEYGSKQAIEDGIIADYEVIIHYVDLDKKIKIKNKKGVEKTEKQSYDGYTYMINKVKEQGGNIQFLSLQRNRISQASIAKIEYVKKLLKQYSDKRVLVFNGLSKTADSLGIPSYYMAKKSDVAIQNFLNNKSDKLALVNIGKSGVTYKDLDCVILNGFTHNDAETSQILSRAQLLDFKNKKAIFHIICLREEAEMKKLNNTLKLIDPKKIKFN